MSFNPMSFDINITLRRGDRHIAAQCAGAGGVTALFGRSGAGKTSVLNMVAGLTRPDAGRIVVDGRVLFDSEQAIDIPPQNRGAGYVFQDIRLFPHMNVEANLLYGWRLAPPENRWITPSEVCAFLGIEPLLRRRPTGLSGGEAQRVAIGRALLSGAKFLLMDEPLSSLDAPRREEILCVIERIVAQLRLPILYVSHDAKEVARLATHIVELA
jgi:molybdate transport system ATP-binding protein